MSINTVATINNIRAKTIVFALFIFLFASFAAKQTIAETKVPVRATVEAIADTAGGTHPVINVETKKLGEVLIAMESRAKEALSGGDEISRVKPKILRRLSPPQNGRHINQNSQRSY